MFKRFLIVVVLACAGCQSSGNIGQLVSHPFPKIEADWIRNGEPIEFENELWYPADRTETLIDSEVMYIGEYRNVQVFVSKEDVRPYYRLYTKFGPFKFRYFEKKKLP